MPKLVRESRVLIFNIKSNETRNNIPTVIQFMDKIKTNDIHDLNSSAFCLLAGLYCETRGNLKSAKFFYEEASRISPKINEFQEMLIRFKKRNSM